MTDLSPGDEILIRATVRNVNGDVVQVRVDGYPSGAWQAQIVPTKSIQRVRVPQPLE